MKDNKDCIKHREVYNITIEKAETTDCVKLECRNNCPILLDSIKDQKKSEKCPKGFTFIKAKEGIDTCVFCGKKAKGRYFRSPKDFSKHEFECIECNKKSFGN